MLTEHRAERRLSQHIRCWKIGLDLDDRSFRIDDLEVEHGVHFHRNVIVRNHVLGWDLDDLDAKVHSNHFLEEGDQQHEARTPHLLKAPKGEDHSPLVLAENFHACLGHDKNNDRSDGHEIETGQQHGTAFPKQSWPPFTRRARWQGSAYHDRDASRVRCCLR
jgi:hypothetical protein